MAFTMSASDLDALRSYLWDHLEPSGSERVAPIGCDHSLRLTRGWARERYGVRHVAPAIAFVRRHGGYCDCEVLMNVTGEEA